MARKKTPQQDNESRSKLIQATLDVIVERGIDGATARAIADKAGVNQALVFYYFSSVQNLIIESVVQMSEQRFKKYEEGLLQSESAQELVDNFFRIFEEDRENSTFTILSQFVAAARNEEEISEAALPLFNSWTLLTKKSLEKVIGSQEMPSTVSIDDLAIAITSALLGVQFMASIPGFEDRVEEMLDNVKSSTSLISLLPMLLNFLPKEAD